MFGQHPTGALQILLLGFHPHQGPDYVGHQHLDQLPSEFPLAFELNDNLGAYSKTSPKTDLARKLYPCFQIYFVRRPDHMRPEDPCDSFTGLPTHEIYKDFKLNIFKERIANIELISKHNT